MITWRCFSRFAADSAAASFSRGRSLGSVLVPDRQANRYVWLWAGLLVLRQSSVWNEPSILRWSDLPVLLPVCGKPDIRPSHRFHGSLLKTSSDAIWLSGAIFSDDLPKRLLFATASCSNTSWSFESMLSSCSCVARNNCTSVALLNLFSCSFVYFIAIADHPF